MGRVILAFWLLSAANATPAAFAGDTNSDSPTDDEQKLKAKLSEVKGEGDAKDSDKAALKEGFGGKVDATAGMTADQIRQYEADKAAGARGEPPAVPDGIGPAMQAAPDAAAAPGGGGSSSGGMAGGRGAGSSRGSGGARAASAAAAAPDANAPATDASRRGDRAFGRATAAASALKNMLHGPEGLPDGGAGAGAGAGAGSASRSAPAAGATGALVPHQPPSLANPQTTQDLALASMGGFGGAFKALGLKIGSGPGGQAAVLRSDGQAASVGEVANLKNLISSEPSALTRRGDFFSALPRDRFDQLKGDFQRQSPAASAAFKDVGMPPTRRDFLWSESCSKVSGDCNAAAQESSYHRGDYVPPEDLNRIWARIKETAQDDAYTAEDLKNARDADAAIAGLGKSIFKPGQATGFLASLSGLLGAAGSFFNGGSSASGGAVSVGPGRAAERTGEGPAAAGAALGTGPRRALAGAVPMSADAAAPESRTAGRALALLGLLSAAALAARLLKRRKAT